MPASIDLDDLSLIDHHCHGVLDADLTQGAFSALLSEAEDVRAIDEAADTPLGLALRRWCAPVLGLEPHASFGDYVERRVSLGWSEVTRSFLTQAHTDQFLIDTGHRADEIADLSEMASLTGKPCREIVRLETLAEDVLATLGSGEDFRRRFSERLMAATADAAGMKSILAYRYGFDLPPEKPSDAAVAAAADVYLRKALQRLTDPTLLSAVLWSGVQVSVERGLPIQLHAGYGDADIMLHRTNPAMLTEWLRAIQPLGVPVVFLHCYPYHREAGYLSAVFPDVYFDVGLAINYLGPSASQLMSESLELAPFSKQLYSSDAFGAAELYYLGARLFRSALSRILGAWVEDDVCSLDDAERIARQIGSENARRLYRLE